MLAVLAQVPRIEGCAYVVPNPKTKLPFVSVFCSWNTARKAAGLPEVRMHDLRHSMASNMVNAGRSIYEVAKTLGHTQLKTSQRFRTCPMRPCWRRWMRLPGPRGRCGGSLKCPLNPLKSVANQPGQQWGKWGNPAGGCWPVR